MNLNNNSVQSFWFNNSINKGNKEAIVHWNAGEDPYRWTYKELFNQALRYSIKFKEAGIKEGEVCAIIIRHNKEFYPIYMGVALINAIPAVLAYPNARLHPDKFRQGIEGMSHRSGLDWIFTERDLENNIRPLVNNDESTIKGLHFPLEYALKEDEEEFEKILDNLNKIKDEDPFLLQHSSGTTGLQKPVLLSHKAVIEHLTNYSESINFRDADKVVSWLPLYHDMGLIAAYHLPLATGRTFVQIDTFEWVLIPSLLLEAISKEKGTICWLPNFAYNILADKTREDELEGIDLSSWRLSINCSEPVRNESHQKFLKRFKPFNLKESLLSTCYAMAETTFAVTQTPYDEISKIVYVDRNELSSNKVKIVDEANGRACISSGKVINDCWVKIVDVERNELPEGYVGEVAIKSVSMFSGYRNYPEKTAEVLTDGWYYSGDYGFCVDGYYYIIGRKKDIIISAGNNIYPEDVEDTINKVDGVIPGRVIAFGEYDESIGSESISVIAESKIEDEAGIKKLKMDIIRAAMAIDVSIKKVYIVPSRWLIKSSAGKPSRKANSERILNKEPIVSQV